MSWLDRLKSYCASEGDAAKPTKPGSVGSVAPGPDGFRNSPPSIVPQRLRVVTPANSEALQPVACRTCAGCVHLLRHGTCAEPVDAGLLTAKEGFGIVWPPEGHGAACPAFIGKMPAAAADRPHRLTNDEGDRCHASCWDDAEIAAFTARAERFALLGRADADDLAERLTLRDRDGDDRRLCLECTWLGDSGRCLAAATGRISGADRRLEPVQTILRQCGAFGLRKGLT